MENWVKVLGFEDYYEVSNYGKIRNCKFIMKQQLDKYGYKYICLTKNKIQKKLKVHRIVLSSFLKEEKNLVCNHKDKNRQNNNLNNLEWVTILENNIHKFLNTKSNVGINKKNNKWYARVQVNKKRFSLGYFDNIEDAINARVLYFKNNGIINKY
jgi:hypothetical protein